MGGGGDLFNVRFQIAQQYPGLMMTLLVKAAKEPDISFEPNNVTVQARSTITAYAIQPNTTLTPLFVLSVVRIADVMLRLCGRS